MKLKRTSLKVLLSASIILSMIPFSIVYSESAAIATLTYAYATDVNVSDVGSGSPFYLYKPRLIYITINMPEESTGVISITTTNYSSNSNVNRLNWDTNCIQVFGAQITKVSTTQFQLNFQHTKQIFIIVGNDTGGSNLPTWYQDVSSWSINGTIDTTPYDEIIANQELIESDISQFLNEFLNYKDNVGIFSTKVNFNFPYSMNINANWNPISTPNTNIGSYFWVQLSNVDFDMSNNCIYHFHLPYRSRETVSGTIKEPELRDGVWTFAINTKATQMHYKEGLTNTMKYLFYTSHDSYDLYIWDIHAPMNENVVLVAPMYWNVSVDYLATGGYYEEIPLNSYLGGMYYTNFQTLYYIKQLANGNTDTNNTINENETINEDLQTESQTYQQLESEFNDNFTDSLENIPTQTLEDHLQTWSTGVNWFRTQMDNIYDNLGEFKYICSIAIVLAIALIFIGR